MGGFLLQGTFYADDDAAFIGKVFGDVFTVDAAINSRYPGMAPEGRRLIEEILIRKEVEKGALLLNEGQISHNLFVRGAKIRFLREKISSV